MTNRFKIENYPKSQRIKQSIELDLSEPHIYIAAGSEWRAYLKGSYTSEDKKIISVYCHPNLNLEAKIKKFFPTPSPVLVEKIIVTADEFEINPEIGISLFNSSFEI